jgi:uncharacterized protein YkwD
MRNSSRRASTALTAVFVAFTIVVATSSCTPLARRLATTTAAVARQPNVSHRSDAPHMHSSRAIVNSLLAKMNAERAARHLRPLQRNRLLGVWANRWARHLVASDGFRHQDLGRIIVSSHYRLAEVGENLFRGSGRGASDAGTAHITLMRSKTHRENVLLPQAQVVGIAAVCVGLKLMVVEDFGIKAGAPLPPRAQHVLPVNPLIAKKLGGASC